MHPDQMIPDAAHFATLDSYGYEGMEPIRGFGNDNEADGAGGIATPAMVPPRLISAATFAGKPIPPRDWLVHDLIPAANVSLLTGDGGTGKSLLALQLAVACAADINWAGIGLVNRPGPAIYLSAEDDLDEIHRRLASICGASGINLARLADLQILPRAGEDAVLARRADGGVRATDLCKAVDKLIQPINPRAIFIDTAADTFGGDENAKAEVRPFITILRGLAMRTGAAVVLLAHPSIAGMASGRGASGNTAWVNSVRSLLYMTRPAGDGGEAGDPDLRVLEQKKSNHSRIGTAFRLRYVDGAFASEGGASGHDRVAAQAHADRVFLKLLVLLNSQGRNVTSTFSRAFAPAVFRLHPECEGVSKPAFLISMERLLSSGQIVNEGAGPPSKRRTYLVVGRAS